MSALTRAASGGWISHGTVDGDTWTWNGEHSMNGATRSYRLTRKAGRQQVSVLACGLSPAWRIAYSTVLHPQVCTRCHPKGSRICEDRRKAFQQT